MCWEPGGAGRLRQAVYLHPVRPLAHRVAAESTQPARLVVDSVGRHVMGVLAHCEEIAACRIDLEAPRRRLGREAVDVGQAARLQVDAVSAEGAAGALRGV